MSNPIQYYCVGFYWNGEDPQNQLPRFIKDGIWENGFNDRYIDKVKAIPIGSRLAAKTTYTRKKNGKIISVLEVHALGTVTKNRQDGKILEVDWDKNFKPFTIDGRGAYRTTISKVNDPENINLIFLGKKENAALKFDEKDIQKDFPLNQILFGPPGTGKTYNTINKAIAIVDNLKEDALLSRYESREEIKSRFNDLFINDWKNPYGQIGFITFHQNMTYEDFIEGIKPSVNEKQEVIYEIEEGIFKMMASIAWDNWLNANKGEDSQISFDEAFSKLQEEWYENPDISFSLKTPNNDYKIIGFTKSSIKFKKGNGSTNHTLSISTLRDYFYKIRDIKQTGVGIYYPSILNKLISYTSTDSIPKEQKNYVLIIDEINRGNVSQIFGELITLIEEDKRLNAKEELQALLPYSKELFGVPPNLYIIGTMNTADRSIEALDTALRRRFSFTEMPPKPELLAPNRMFWNLMWLYKGVEWEHPEYQEKEKNLLELFRADEILWKDRKTIWDSFLKEGSPKESQIFRLKEEWFSGINLQKILQIINKRLNVLLDKDHQIGHSYFISINSLEELKEVFHNKIIPLLQEYFFGDTGKIGLVLGSGFVKVEENNVGVLASFDGYDTSDYEDKTIYQTKNVLNMNNDEFTNALKVLLK
jgi:5-methylcytosine-specific restriction protein B